jgi:aminoglycoside 6'-N-acetyltransferase I
VGRRLLDAMLALGKSIDCAGAWVGTELDNTPARGLYRRRDPKTEQTFVLYEYDL